MVDSVDTSARNDRRRARVAESSWRGEIRSILSVVLGVMRRWFLSVNAKYGLRGVRIGEAANPGPPSRRRRAQRLRALQWSWDSDTESDEEGRHVIRRLEAQSTDTDDHPLVAQSSPPGEVIRALEEDLCRHPRASRRFVLAPQSPGGTPVSIQDPTPSVTEFPVSASQGFPEPATLLASSGAVRQVNRGGTIVDSSEDEPVVQRVSSVPAGSFGSVLWDSQTSNENVGPTRVVAVPWSRHIDRRTRRRLNLVWRAPDPVPVQNEVDDVFESQAPFVEASREVVPERVGGVQSHVMEALEDDLDQEKEEVPVVDPSGAARIPVRNRFSVLESTVRDTECLMSTVVDRSSGNVEVFPMTDDAAGHVPREPRVQLDRRRLQVQDTPQSIQDRQSDESEGEVAAVTLSFGCCRHRLCERFRSAVS